VLGRRQTVLYVASLIGASLAFGPIMGWITAIAGWTPPASLHAGHGGGFMLQDYLLGGLFALLILASLFRRWWPEEWMPWKDSAAAEQALSDTEPPSGTAPLYDVLSVEGMTCHHCAANVEDAVRSVHGVTGARVDLKGKKVFIEGPVLSRDPEAIAKAVRRAGYEPAGYGE
jgi:uncharacterized protein